MRKLKLQVQISADGYIAGPNGEMDWMTCNWDDDLTDRVNELTAPVDTILLGRKMADGFMTYWTNAKNNPEDPDHMFGIKMMDTPKVVFTKTLDKCPWENTVLAAGDLTEEVNKLKSQDGGDIIVYGGAGFDRSLIAAGLIDELYLFVNPTAIGVGLPIFSGHTELQVVSVKVFKCGITEICYLPRESK